LDRAIDQHPPLFLPGPCGTQTCPFFLDLGLCFESHFILLPLQLEGFGFHLLRETALAIQLRGEKTKHRNIMESYWTIRG
jgi:hypothetical protein